MPTGAGKLVASGIFEVPPPVIGSGSSTTTSKTNATAAATATPATATPASAAAQNPNPLSPLGTTATQNFALPPRPKLAQMMKGSVFTKSDAQAHDAADERWRQSVERLIIEQFARIQTQIPKG